MTNKQVDEEGLRLTVSETAGEPRDRAAQGGLKGLEVLDPDLEVQRNGEYTSLQRNGRELWSGKVEGKTAAQQAGQFENAGNAIIDDYRKTPKQGMTISNDDVHTAIMDGMNRDVEQWMRENPSRE